jgi:hypothetical protein
VVWLHDNSRLAFHLSATYLFAQNSIDFAFDGSVPVIASVDAQKMVVFAPGLTSMLALISLTLADPFQSLR